MHTLPSGFLALWMLALKNARKSSVIFIRSWHLISISINFHKVSTVVYGSVTAPCIYCRAKPQLARRMGRPVKQNGEGPIRLWKSMNLMVCLPVQTNGPLHRHRPALGIYRTRRAMMRLPDAVDRHLDHIDRTYIILQASLRRTPILITAHSGLHHRIRCTRRSMFLILPQHPPCPSQSRSISPFRSRSPTNIRPRSRHRPFVEMRWDLIGATTEVRVCWTYPSHLPRYP